MERGQPNPIVAIMPQLRSSLQRSRLIHRNEGLQRTLTNIGSAMTDKAWQLSFQASIFPARQRVKTRHRNDCIA
jgi:hypothetical protein